MICSSKTNKSKINFALQKGRKINFALQKGRKINFALQKGRKINFALQACVIYERGQALAYSLWHSVVLCVLYSRFKFLRAKT